jgi:hypothetical protein
MWNIVFIPQNNRYDIMKVILYHKTKTKVFYTLVCKDQSINIRLFRNRHIRLIKFLNNLINSDGYILLSDIGEKLLMLNGNQPGIHNGVDFLNSVKVGICFYKKPETGNIVFKRRINKKRWNAGGI